MILDEIEGYYFLYLTCTSFEVHEVHSLCTSFGAHKKPITLSLTNKFTPAPYFVPQMCLKFVPHLRHLRHIVFVPHLRHIKSRYLYFLLLNSPLHPPLCPILYPILYPICTPFGVHSFCTPFWGT